MGNCKLKETMLKNISQLEYIVEGKLYHLISHNYRSVFEKKEAWEKDLPDEYRRLLLIADYICGMTDTFALRLHAQITQGV